MNAWPQLSKPIDPLMNTELARLMSLMTKGGKVPEFEDVEAALYAARETLDGAYPTTGD